MRRQARISTGGTLIMRTASALQVWLWLLIFVFQNEFRISRSIQPGYLDFDNLPETNFTCTGKVIGGYYADLETSCQMFHVCTVGQQDEPMDIKFLCLNGTVFDQETRVCERVDEVDCTKSEKFYSLNLELYGSTAPPIIESDQPKPQAQPTEQAQQQSKPSYKQEKDPSVDDSATTSHDKTQEHLPDNLDSTEDPIQDIKKGDDIKNPQKETSSTQSVLPLLDNDEASEDYQEEDVDNENPEYEEDYVHHQTTTITIPTTTLPTTTSNRQKLPQTTATVPPTTSPRLASPLPHLISISSPSISTLSPPSPDISSLSPPIQSSILPSAPALPTLDPSLLSPQEFIYRHHGPGSEAISFQRQSFRPADGVYITHAPPQQFDHFPYESSRTAPRPVAPRPVPFVQRPHPAPFRPTTLDPRDQLLRPGPTSQSSERHESTVKHRHQSHPHSLPAQRPLPFNSFYYDRKRSDDSSSENESSLSARSVAPPPKITEKPPPKPKSPPRVIVTASASVSDSNGKRLNYTVGNVVSAVIPSVQINYDDYKESDFLFDPFFLDVPKLQKRRKTRSNRKRRVFTVSETATISTDLQTEKTTATTYFPVTSRATTTEGSPTFKTTTPAAWNPNDYVDDNYEPHAYIPPAPPLAVLVSSDGKKTPKQESQIMNSLYGEKNYQDQKITVGSEQTRTLSAGQTSSSQSVGRSFAPPAASPPPPPPLEASIKANCSVECRTQV